MEQEKIKGQAELIYIENEFLKGSCTEDSYECWYGLYLCKVFYLGKPNLPRLLPELKGGDELLQGPVRLDLCAYYSPRKVYLHSPEETSVFPSIVALSV